MGGSDDPSNIVELTIEEHAEAHKQLYEQYGRQEDYLAWKGLSGMMGKDDIIRELMSLTHKGKKLTEKQVEQNRLRMKELFATGEHVFCSEEFRQNTSKRNKELLEKGEFIFQTPGFHERRIASQKAKGTNKFTDPNFQKEMAQRAKKSPNAPYNITYTCPHCGKVGKGNFMKVFHFDKCKSLAKSDASNLFPT
jgi:predicted RNA-binding Zn-ribbon protein involved in translation (DUF1610 family)